MVPPPMQPGFYLAFIVWGRSPKWPKATSFLGWSGGIPPGNFLKWICAEMQCGAFESQFWEMLQWYFILFFQSLSRCDNGAIIHVPCHIVSLDREYLLNVHWPRRVWVIFRYSYLQTVMITIFFWGGGGELSIFLWGSFYPSSTLDRTLKTTHLASPTCLKTWDGVP